MRVDVRTWSEPDLGDLPSRVRPWSATVDARATTVRWPVSRTWPSPRCDRSGWRELGPDRCRGRRSAVPGGLHPDGGRHRHDRAPVYPREQVGAAGGGDGAADGEGAAAGPAATAGLVPPTNRWFSGLVFGDRTAAGLPAASCPSA